MRPALFRLPWLTPLAVVLALLAGLAPAPAAAAGPIGEPVILGVPWRTQFDDSPYAAANCGPATIGMVLGAFGLNVATHDLRKIVIQLQGSAGYDDGTYIENLARMAERYGVAGLQLSDESGSYHRWTLGDIRYQLRAGRPVVPQVHYRSLPGHEDSTYYGDHYVAIVGYDGEDFLYHDPAMRAAENGMRRISGEQLFLAMKRSDFPFAALSFAARGGERGAQRLQVVNVQPIPGAPSVGASAPAALRGATEVARLEPRGGAIRQPTASAPEIAEAVEPSGQGLGTQAASLTGGDAGLISPAWLGALALPLVMGIARSHLLLRRHRTGRLFPSATLWLPRRSSAPLSTEAR